MGSDTNWLEVSTDELDLLLGHSLLAGSLGSKSAGERDKRVAAQRWLSANLERIQVAVCTNESVRRMLADPLAGDRERLHVAVTDALAAVPGLGIVPTAALGARLVHFGVGRLCAVPEESRRP